MNSEWCEHLHSKFSKVAQKQRWFFKRRDIPWAEAVADDFLICPVCKTPRPEEKRELWEILTNLKAPMSVQGNLQYIFCLDETLARNAAKAAKTWFWEMVDLVKFTMVNGEVSEIWIKKSDLKALLSQEETGA
jgi:hypothetical protein